jgi:putative membrane protein
MGKFLSKTIVTAVAVLIAAYLLTGVTVADTFTAIIVAVVLGVLNNFIKPILVILTIPITIFTLGIFLLFINVFIIQIATKIVPGFIVDGWWTALFFSFLVALVTSVLESLIGSTDNTQSKN